MGAHIKDGLFQSDKYPTCPTGKVPLSVKDTTAQDLLWEYAQRRRAVDAEFSKDLESALRAAGYTPPPTTPAALPDAPDAESFFIWESAAKTGWHAIFWRPSGNGYTLSLDEAGVYAADEARAIASNPSREDLAVPVAMARALARPSVDRDRLRSALAAVKKEGG